MSDLSAAAAALGVPEAIVQRSAEARATETGMTVDEVLAVWAGGGAAPVLATPTAPPPAEAPAAAEEPAEVTPVAETVAAPPSAGETPTGPPAEQGDTPRPEVGAPTTVSGKPPVLVGEEDNPMAVFVGVVVLFVAIFLVGLVGPAMPSENPGARSSELPYSETALRGQHIYQSVGCSACHTQMVRPVVSDVDLGAVTLNDSNQVLGTRRFGPDLSNAGARLSRSQIEATVSGLGGHPGLGLSQDDLNDLVAYLVESQTTTDVPDQQPEETEEEPTES